MNASDTSALEARTGKALTLLADGLNSRYTQTGTVLLNGNQAIVRLLLEQSRRDRRQGLNTAGFVSGYRGSPLGTLDMALWDARELLDSAGIRFVPGINEDLAATSVWGTQFIGQYSGNTVDGVFGLWYGKGPGVDRSGDALKHGNLSGTAAVGGAVVIAGDDHGAKSSTTAHQSEPALIAAGIPILYPSSVQEILELGLHAYAMSRYSGCWIALKLVTDIVESTASVSIGAVQPLGSLASPPPSDVHLRKQDRPLDAEARLLRRKLPAATAYAAAHCLDSITFDSPTPTIGIIAAGKSYSDVRQALHILDIDESACSDIGIRVIKLALVWPMNVEFVRQACQGLKSVIVVEEKRPLIEDQLKAALYDLDATLRPSIIGKGAVGSWTTCGHDLPAYGELSPLLIARCLAPYLGVASPRSCSENFQISPPRLPTFCSGCPHSLSTRVPNGSRAMGGIGCHGMVTHKRPDETSAMAHMGGEGALWIGQAPFTTENHVFANMGDGTYFHSGLLAIRAAIAANITMTYKLLVNGFVSMTGGQAIDGPLSIPGMVQVLRGEGVKNIVIVTDDTDRYSLPSLKSVTEIARVFPREALESVQQTMRMITGVSVLIYDQPCATELRRLRKRGERHDPTVRTFIHPEVCEGCGDCGEISDCLSLEPLETPFGRKRAINQSSCNKDRSCIRGFCPSFVTVHGGTFLPSGETATSSASTATRAPPSLPLPHIAPAGRPTNVLIAGIGGTGVVTISTVIAMAAHIDGHHVSALDVTGLSQKYGMVQSHVRLGHSSSQLHSPRLDQGEADVLIGCDLLVSAASDVTQRLNVSSARGVVSQSIAPTEEFARNPDWVVSEKDCRAALEKTVRDLYFFDAIALSRTQLGDTIGANMILLGFAWQRGWLPVSLDAIEQAISLNGAAIKMNLKAFSLGRLVAYDPAWLSAVRQTVDDRRPSEYRVPARLSEWMTLHEGRLIDYQGKSLVVRYRAKVSRIAARSRDIGLDETIAITAARSYFKLLAHKDEFEVARLLGKDEFIEGISRQFEGRVSIHFHLAGGGVARKGKEVPPAKQEFKSWILPVLRLLGKSRWARNTWLDPWRSTAERKLAASLLSRFEADLDRIGQSLSLENADAMQQLAAIPEKRIRGYGHIRERNAAMAVREREQILDSL